MMQGGAVETGLRRDGERSLVAVAVAVLFVAALLLRLHRLGDADFSGDETDLWRYVIDGVPSPQEPPLPRIVTRLWLELVRDDGNAVVRFPAAVAGALTVVGTLFLGRALAGLPAGIFAAFVLCVHPFAIAWSQRLRPYGILGLLTVLSLLAYLGARRRRTPGAIALLAATLALTTASHALGALMVGAIVLDSVLRMLGRVRKQRPWMEAARTEGPVLIGSALGMLGLVWTAFRPNVASVATPTPLSRFPGVLTDISRILAGTLDSADPQLAFATTVVVTWGVLFGAATLWREESSEKGGRALVLAGGLVVLLVAATLGTKASFGAREWSRYVSNAIPLVAIAMGAALARVPSVRARAAVAVLGVAIASASTLGGWSRAGAGGRLLSQFAASVKEQEPGLRGVLVVGQRWWVERWAINYFRLRQDDLPGYTLSPHEPPRLVRAVPKTSTAVFRLARPFGAVAGSMPSGTYAVLSQSSEGCAALLQIAPERVQSSHKVREPGASRNRYGVCEVTFFSTP